MNYLTLHMLYDLPWHNMNRDANGRPKRLSQGGVTRTMLSSQSLKRAHRSDYEATNPADVSYRSAEHIADLVVERAQAVFDSVEAERLDETAVLRMREQVAAAVHALVSRKQKKGTVASEAADDESRTARSATDSGSKATNAWLSSDEIDLLAEAALEDALDRMTAKKGGDVVVTHEHLVGTGGRTASLSIAMFGRMFANAADRQTEAAVAVSPAVTTHRAVIETDYFTTVDDLGVIYGDGDRGASYLDTAMFTTGVYYRTVTFDRDQLARSWSLLGAAGSDDRLRAMVRSVLYALPSGKKNATAAQTRPLVVLAEEQSCRCAYSFDTPVQPADGGGYVGGSLVALADKRQRALAFDPTAFGAAKVAGTAEGLDAFGAEVVDGPQLVDFVSDWLLGRA